MENAQILYDALRGIIKLIGLRYDPDDRSDDPSVRLGKIKWTAIDAVVDYDNAEIVAGRETGRAIGAA